MAGGGKQARDVVREQRPAIAFLDAALPGIDGYNILLEVRNRNEDAAVFITSNRGDDFRQAKALELGADDFIVKPFSLEVTASRIRREIKKRQNRRTPVNQRVGFAGVSGSLEDMSALDVVQSLELGKKQAHVVLQYEDGRSGTLHVREGVIRGAALGDTQGEEAFYGLMRGGRGLFRIEYGSSDTPENITKPNTDLMIEAMRRLDPRGPEHPSALESETARLKPQVNLTKPMEGVAPPDGRMVSRAPIPQPVPAAHSSDSLDLTKDLVLELPPPTAAEGSNRASPPQTVDIESSSESPNRIGRVPLRRLPAREK